MPFAFNEPSEALSLISRDRVRFDMYTTAGKKMVYGFAVPNMVAGDTELFMSSERL